jgi:ABC-type dipeptide/oligopeptide/nickel transport systems, permease components
MARSEALDLETIPGLTLRRQRGLWSDAVRRLARNRLALAALILLAIIAITAILANYVPFVQRYDPAMDQDYSHLQEGPSFAHFFGTDALGRDNWSRVMQGALISLQVGIAVQIMVLVIGLTIGSAAALGGRWMDNAMMRFTDLTYAFPDLLAIILLRSVFAERDLPLVSHSTSQLFLVIFAIGFVAWVTVARLVRGQMLGLKERDFVTAARAMGASQWRIVVVHMLPNTLGTVTVAVVFGIPLAIFAEAVLAFIGIGLPPPTASLGRLISEGNSYIQVNVWVVVFPAGVIALLMLCFTFLGDGLRDALDPRTR